MAFTDQETMLFETILDSKGSEFILTEHEEAGQREVFICMVAYDMNGTEVLCPLYKAVRQDEYPPRLTTDDESDRIQELREVKVAMMQKAAGVVEQ